MYRATPWVVRACLLGTLSIALLTLGLVAPAQAATSTVTGTIKLYDKSSPDGVEVRLVRGGAISDPYTITGSSLDSKGYYVGTYTFSGITQDSGYYIYAAFPDSNPKRAGYSASNGSQNQFSVPTNNEPGLYATLQKTIGCTTTVSGSYTVGSTLSASMTYDSDFSGSTKTLSTSWYRYTDPSVTTPVGSGTTYTLTDADAGSHIGFTATFQNAGGGRDGRCRTADSTSAPTVAARPSEASGSSALVGGVGIAGKHRTKKTVSAVVSPKPGATIGYQWYRVTTKASRGHKKHHGVRIRPIKGANAAGYRIRGKDRGARLFVRVTGGGPGYAATVLDSGWIKIRR